MSEQHVLDWIGAYHDGELRGDRLRRVEAHLRACAACQAELDALQRLTARLHAAPPMPGRTPPEQFVAQVRLQLAPRRGPVSDRDRLRQAVGLWAPLGVVALWALGQAALLVGALALAVLPGAWPVVLPPLPGLAALPLLGVALAAPAGSGALALLALQIGLTVVAAGLVGGCLAGWWAAGQGHFEANIAPSGEQAGR
jgi:anti-sigma factor RsiW